MKRPTADILAILDHSYNIASYSCSKYKNIVIYNYNVTTFWANFKKKC